MKLALAWLLLTFAVSAVGAGAETADAIQKGRTFLVDLFDPELDLLPEYQGANVYCSLPRFRSTMRDS